MKIRHLFVALLAMMLPFVATACGDDSTGDLSTDDISKSLQEGGLPKEQADCMASKVQDADLTKDELEEFTKTQDTESKAGKALMDAVLSCADLGT